MSYILDALKKSDQQRNIGATPTLQFAQASMPAPKRPSIFYYGLLAVVLLCAGVAIGLLRPWQAEQVPAGNQPIAKDSPVTILQQAGTKSMPAIPDAPGNTAQNSPTQNAAPAVTPITAVPMQQKPDAAPVAQDQKVISLYDLPPAIQRELPDIAVQLHAYSDTPSERLVSINSIRLREGGYLMAGLKLEQITPDGMIFSYKGYRFKRGVR
jgi:general secretion pathway protein B